jgi:hypothetical protein
MSNWFGLPARRVAGRVRPRPISVELSNIGRGTLINISESGALVDISDPQNVGREVAFSLEWDRLRLDLRGSIVRCKLRQEGGGRLVWAEATSYEIAVRFAEMPASSAKILADVIGALSGVSNGKVVDMALRRKHR